jgi:hypothetical protein
MSDYLNEYPLPGVTLREVESVKEIINPLYRGLNMQSSPGEFFLLVPEVGSFYACGGNEVKYAVEKNADPEWVRLCLCNQVLAALLHQRQIINFHASSFVYNDKGIMILGETGAGKSSLTASFILDGAGFLTDDLTPVTFEEEIPFIVPLERRIKLVDDSIEQLDIPGERLKRAEAGTGKHYLQTDYTHSDNYPLQTIFRVEIGDNDRPLFYEPDQTERFSIMRSEICSWEMLAGMPDTESAYLHQLLRIVQNTRIVKLTRPRDISIKLLSKYLTDYILKEM